jgi:hypothetical protein
MGFNPLLDKIIINAYKRDAVEELNNELIDFHEQLSKMIQNLQAENIELLLNMGIERNILNELKEHIDKYCK